MIVDCDRIADSTSVLLMVEFEWKEERHKFVSLSLLLLLLKSFPQHLLDLLLRAPILISRIAMDCVGIAYWRQTERKLLN